MVVLVFLTILSGVSAGQKSKQSIPATATPMKTLVRIMLMTVHRQEQTEQPLPAPCLPYRRAGARVRSVATATRRSGDQVAYRQRVNRVHHVATK